MRQGAIFDEFYNKIEQILGLGDEAGDCFPGYFVRTIRGREVFYSLLSKYHMRHEGSSFYCFRKSDEGGDTDLM